MSGRNLVLLFLFLLVCGACVVQAGADDGGLLAPWRLTGVVYEGIPIATGALCLAILAAGVRRTRRVHDTGACISIGVATFVSVLAVCVVALSLLQTLDRYVLN